MIRTILKSKIHRATVTDSNVHYEGSITIDKRLMNAAGIVEYEQVHVWDVSNGHRLITYAIGGPPTGKICMNGAAARLIHVGDIIIIAAFGSYDIHAFYENDVLYLPKIVHVDENNKAKS